MIKKIGTLAFVFLAVLSFGQKRSSVLPEYQKQVTKFKWTIFVTSDSLYKITRFIDQTGRYYFKQGFIDSTYAGDSVITFIKQKRNMYGYIDSMKYEKGIDTVSCYFSSPTHYNTSKETIINRITYVINPLYEDIALSYVFRAFNFRSFDNAIFILFPEDELNFSHKYYFISLQEAANDYHWLFFYSSVSDNLDGFHLTNKDSMLLSDKKLSSVLERISEVRQIHNKFVRA